jgi:hypothetical protein
MVAGRAFGLIDKPNIPLAVIEAKDNNCSVGDGIQQALEYAQTLKIPFVFSSNGDGHRDQRHDRKTLQLDQFPAPAELWRRYCEWKGLPREEEPIVLQSRRGSSSGFGAPGALLGTAVPRQRDWARHEGAFFMSRGFCHSRMSPVTRSAG